MDGLPREIDDFNRRVQLKLSSHTADLFEEEEIDAFPKKFIVGVALVRNGLADLKAAKVDKELRASDKAVNGVDCRIKFILILIGMS